MKPLIVIRSGYVRSRYDGDEHLVSAGQVARLHGLRAGEWRLWNDHAKYPEGTIFLGPRSDGNYRDLRHLT